MIKLGILNQSALNKSIFCLFFCIVLYIGCKKEVLFTLDVNVTPPSSGTTSVVSGNYQAGQSVSISATPASEYIFKGWTGSVTSTDNPLSVLMDASKSITANFEKKTSPNPNTSTVAKLVKLPAGWKFDTNISNGFPEGVEVYTFDTLFNGNRIKSFAVAFDPKLSYLDFKPTLSSTAKKTSEFFSQESGVVYACMNGGFFGGGQSYSLVKYNTVLSPNIKSVNRSYNGTSVAYYPTRAAFGISSTGAPSVAWIYHIGTTNERIYEYAFPSPNQLGSPPQAIPDENFPSAGKEWKVAQAIGGSPVLIKNVEINITDKEELIDINNTSSRPRSAIGYTENGMIIMLAVEGDNANNGIPGVNLKTLAEFLKNLGCTNAINLDGGGSTSLIINNKSTVRPGDNGAERAVSSVVILKQK